MSTRSRIEWTETTWNPTTGCDRVSAGMVQLPPVMVSAPFKILLFVLVDGWNLVVGSLLRSFS